MTHDTLHSPSTRGQIAIGFLTVIALALILVTTTVNVGQMAQVRVETSNAADAGALAGASWIASGMNEAGLVAGKISEAILLVQTIYLVPFCPGAEQTSYAEQLWYSLEEHPYALDPVLFGPGFRRRGPAPYFREVADDAMWAAWYVGSREWYTAAINNLMIRYPTGSGVEVWGPECRGLGWSECAGTYSNFISVAAQIRAEQERLNRSGAVNDHSSVTWNNMLPFDNRMNLTHTAPLEVEFPDHAPQLDLAPERGIYRQYEAARAIILPDIPNPVFTCDFEGWGIRTGYSGPNDPDALFVLMPDDLLNYSINPLQMVKETLTLPGDPVLGLSADYWRKEWDVPWRRDQPPDLSTLSGSSPYAPSPKHLDDISRAVNGREALGTCLTPEGDPQYVCGVAPQETRLDINVRPVGFLGGDGSVSVAVGHKVETADGARETMFSYAPLPQLTARFDGAASKAKAKYTPPRFTYPALTEGKAELEEVW